MGTTSRRCTTARQRGARAPSCLRFEALPSLDSQNAAPPDSPAYLRRGRLGGDAPFVKPVKVTPRTERGDVFVFVASAVRAKHEVMWRHVSARAHRARATKHVAPVYAEVLGERARFGEAPLPQRR